MMDVENIHVWGAYYQGARMMLLHLWEHYDLRERCAVKDKDAGVYMKAIVDFALTDKRNCELFMAGERLRFRNHERNKKGRLVRCEAYAEI